MPYTISEATDPLKIKEHEHGSATKGPACAANSFQWEDLASRYRKQ
jgi:hypothetical protein